MDRWLKRHPLTFFLFLSLTAHGFAIYLNGSPGKNSRTVPAGIIEVDYHPLQLPDKDKAENYQPPIPPEEKRADLEKEVRDEVASSKPATASLPPEFLSLKPEPAGTLPPRSAPPVATPSSREGLQEYVEQLYREIDSRKQYPELGVKMRLEGSVVVSFTLDRNGRLLALDIPSGGESSFVQFNQEALRAVRRASAQFPPFPDSLSEETINFRLPVSFVIK